MMGWLWSLLILLPPRVPGVRQSVPATLGRNLVAEQAFRTGVWSDPASWRQVNAKHVVIRLKEGITENHPSLRSLFQAYHITRIVDRSHYPDRMNFIMVELPESSVSLAQSFMQACSTLPEILYAEPEVVFRLSSCTPNDPYFWDPNANAIQWGYFAVGADSAWCSTTGSASIGVAVLDAGIMYTHPDIQANYAGGYDFIENDNDPYPSDGVDHGTHVGGTIAAVWNNGVGVAGFGNFSLYSLRVCTAQGCSSTALANALLTVAYTPGIHVANMSLGSGTYSQIVYDAADTAYYSYGKLLVAAAGNDGNPIVDFPASFPSVIAVSAYAWDGGYSGNYYYLAPYSNYGAGMGLNPPPYGLELSAPGGDVNSYAWFLGILSTGFDTTFTPNYPYYEGTSMAAPHVSGLAALVLSRAQSMGIALNASTLRSILDDNAVDQGIWIGIIGSYDPAGVDIYTGYGAINAIWAINDPRVGVSEPRPVPDRPSASLTWDPIRHLLQINPGQDLPTHLEGTLLDATGREVERWEWTISGPIHLRLSRKPGIYFVRIRLHDEVIQRKLLLQH